VFFVSYSTHGYGHLSRSHRIAAALAACAPIDAVVVSSHPDFVVGLDTPHVHEIRLPSSGLAPGDPRPARPDAGGLALLRSRLLRELVERFRPRGLLIDFFPFGPHRASAECEEALAWLREHAPDTLLCAGFRGMIPRQYSPGDLRRVQELLEQYADVFFVYLDAREEEAVLAAYPFLRSIGPRIRFVGYVASPRYRGGPRAGRILATFGSGIHGHSRIRLTCEAFLAFARRHPAHTLEVVTGSRLPEAAYRDVVRDYDGTGGIRVIRFVPGLGRMLGEYELVIAIGGYNTLVELYQTSTRSIVLCGDETIAQTKERMANALRFARAGAVDRVLETGATTPADLAAAMEEVLGRPAPERREIDVAGATTTARILIEELQRRAGAADGGG
jgi:predicted glycosyltransferase